MTGINIKFWTLILNTNCTRTGCGWEGEPRRFRGLRGPQTQYDPGIEVTVSNTWRSITPCGRRGVRVHTGTDHAGTSPLVLDTTSQKDIGHRNTCRHGTQDGKETNSSVGTDVNKRAVSPGGLREGTQPCLQTPSAPERLCE